MATGRQTNLLRQLVQERVMKPEDKQRLLGELDGGLLDTQAASKAIGWLFQQPRIQPLLANGKTGVAIAERPAPAPTPKRIDVAAGRYAIEFEGSLKFFRVDKPTEGKYAGRTFVKVQASDDYWPIKDFTKRNEILSRIAADPKKAMLRYGVELGHCGHCGRTLTDEQSRERGIGPICAAKLEW